MLSPGLGQLLRASAINGEVHTLRLPYPTAKITSPSPKKIMLSLDGFIGKSWYITVQGVALKAVIANPTE
jgi:hypothetical protein